MRSSVIGFIIQHLTNLCFLSSSIFSSLVSLRNEVSNQGAQGNRKDLVLTTNRHIQICGFDVQPAGRADCPIFFRAAAGPVQALPCSDDAARGGVQGTRVTATVATPCAGRSTRIFKTCRRPSSLAICDSIRPPLVSYWPAGTTKVTRQLG